MERYIESQLRGTDGNCGGSRSVEMMDNRVPDVTYLL